MFNFKKFLNSTRHIFVAPENLEDADHNSTQLEEYYYNLMEPVREYFWELEDIHRNVSSFAIYPTEAYDFAKSWNAAR